MKPETIGYIICESAIPGFIDTNIIEEKNGRLIGEGILQTANEKNRNGRFYDSRELFPQLTSPRILELLEAGYLRSELGHPLSSELVRQQTIDDSRTCAQFLKLWTDGDNIWGRFRGTNNAFGDAFDKDLRDGCKPAWSLRALGNIVKTNRGDEVRNLKIITWDQVIYPSHPHAYTHNVITESASYGNENDVYCENAQIVPITNKSVIEYIKSESANLKYLNDYFDTIYKSIKIDSDNSRVTLTCESGEILVVNLERYINDEIMNYASELHDLIEY